MRWAGMWGVYGRGRSACICMLCACGAVGNELQVFIEFQAYNGLQAKYGTNLSFQWRSMPTIVNEAPQLALASSHLNIWETRHSVLRRTAPKRTRTGDDQSPWHRNNPDQLSVPPWL